MIRYKCVSCGNTLDVQPARCIRCAGKKFSEIYIKDTLTETDERILKDTNLFQKILEESGKRAVGEEKAKKSLILFCMGRLVANASASSFNAIPHEESGTGKDYLTKAITSLCVPKEELAHRTRISQTVLNYWHDPKSDPDWTWDGKVLFLEDVSDSVLNCEVMKTFLSGGSQTTITINQRAVDIEIRGKPVIFLTTANSSPGAEQLRRIQFVPLDSSKEQTGRIKQFQATIAQNGSIQKYDNELVEALSKLTRQEVIIPWAEKLIQHFPEDLIVRTVQGRFLDLIKASTALHQLQREHDEEGRLIAERQDYEIARDVFLHNSSTGGTLTPMTVHQKKIIQAIKDRSTVKFQEEHGFMEVSEISGFLVMGKETLYSNLEKLVVSGILGLESGVVLSSGKTGSRYCVKKTVSFNLPEWKEIGIEFSRNDLTNRTNKTNRTNRTDIDSEELSSVVSVGSAKGRPSLSNNIVSEEIVVKEL